MSRLIAFEGGDGVGKATQSKLLVEELDKRGIAAVLFSFPRYDTPIGRAIRRHLRSETVLAVAERQESEHNPDCYSRFRPGCVCDCNNKGLLRSSDDALAFQCLMLADKYEASHEIWTHLRNGTFVICDRWLASSLAYGTTDGLDRAWLERIHGSLPQPTLTFYLQVPEAVALARRPGLRDRYEKDREKQLAVARVYDDLATSLPDSTGWVTVDGSGTVAEVAATILNHVEGKLL